MVANWLAGRIWLRKRLKQISYAYYANSKTQLTTYNLLILLQMPVRLPRGICSRCFALCVKTGSSYVAQA